MKRLLLLLPILTLLACDEQQVLYKTESPEPIPPVPGLAELANDPHSQIRGPEALSGSELPPPVPTDFKPMDLTEPLRTESLVGLEFPLPERFAPVESPSEMRIAQWTVPPKRGTGNAELVAFYFGPGQGGGAADNASRWMRQFTPMAGATSPLVSLQEGYPPGLVVTRVVMEGDYDPGQMSQSPDGPKPGELWRLDALIIEGGPEGTLFLRMTGPAKTVSAEAGAMLHAAAMVRGPGGDEAPAVVNAGTKLQRVEAPGVTLAVPGDWEPGTPSSQMRAVEMTMASGGEVFGEFVIFYFGPGGGGTAKDNIARWIGQVKTSDGGTPKAETEHVDVGNFHIDTVYVEGTYAPTAMGPAMPKPIPQPNQALFGAVIPGASEGSLYIRATGPAEKMRAVRGDLDAMVKSLRPRD